MKSLKDGHHKVFLSFRSIYATTDYIILYTFVANVIMTQLTSLVMSRNARKMALATLPSLTFGDPILGDFC